MKRQQRLKGGRERHSDLSGRGGAPLRLKAAEPVGSADRLSGFPAKTASRRCYDHFRSTYNKKLFHFSGTLLVRSFWSVPRSTESFLDWFLMTQSSSAARHWMPGVSSHSGVTWLNSQVERQIPTVL
eukprot:scaffold1610_cov257-Pinguiococcus_pyrenoidosus.AAC.39